MKKNLLSPFRFTILNFRVPIEIEKRVKLQASDRQVTVSEVLREAVDLYLSSKTAS